MPPESMRGGSLLACARNETLLWREHGGGYFLFLCGTFTLLLASCQTLTMDEYDQSSQLRDERKDLWVAVATASSNVLYSARLSRLHPAVLKSPFKLQGLFCSLAQR